ncbi:unnamed protein product [Sphagnum troendelagicum]
MEEAAVMEERMGLAVVQACRALRQRHREEEGAHGPALAALFTALSRPPDGELHGKMEALQLELSQSYQKQSQLSEQLLHEVTGAQAFREQLVERENSIVQLQAELLGARGRVTQLEEELEKKERALEASIEEMKALRIQVEELDAKLVKAQAENRMLIDRWMEQKMKDAERLNEANAMYEDMMERFKGKTLDDLARAQVDGIVRHSEAGAEDYVESGMPTSLRHAMRAHDGGCSTLKFEHGGGSLISGGHDRLVRTWDTERGVPLATLRGCLGSVLDLALSHDDTMVLAASADHKLYLWEVQSGRIRHTLTGHAEKVCAVDYSKASNRRAVSAAQDRTIKIWDLQTGYGVNTIVCHSNCNAVALTMDGDIVCSGHMDGNLRLWDVRSGKSAIEVAAHGQGITSVSLSKSGNAILTSGRDNVHTIFDVRTLEAQASFRALGFRVATNWSRSCLSGDESYVSAGSIDGSVLVWSRRLNETENSLKHHPSAVLACAWSNVRRRLASADKNGGICIWE